VVDNGSLDDSRSVCGGYPARFLPLGENLGFSRAYNRAVGEAKGEHLFIVNNDMRFLPDCLSRLARVLAADPTLFAVDPTQLSWDGTRVIHGRTSLRRGTFHSTVIPPFAVEYTAAADGHVEVPWGCAGSQARPAAKPGGRGGDRAGPRGERPPAPGSVGGALDARRDGGGRSRDAHGALHRWRGAMIRERVLVTGGAGFIGSHLVEA